jgi:glycerophosphoryl diester phosphodiesterase
MAYASARRALPVEIIGHRGSPRARRENTLPSFERAFAEGADAVELDVHATRDGIVVIHHDAVTNSRLGEQGPKIAIADSTSEVIRSVPIDGGSIPTLAELLALAPRTTTIYVEVKAPAIEPAVVSAIRNSGKQCAVHSFDHRISRRVHDLDPTIPVGILQTSYPVDPLRPLHDAGARDLWQHWELIDETLIDRVRKDGGRVIAWTVNDPVLARRLLGWGVDGLCTDVPAVMRSLIDAPRM